MKDEIVARVRALGAAERLAATAKLAATLRQLERELREVSQEIPFWSRLVFFRESPDQQREREITATIAQVRRELEATRAQLAHDLERVGDELPPFAVAIQVELCRDLVRSRDPNLVLPLERLAARIRATWAPRIDEATALESLASATACAEAAKRATGEPARDKKLLWAPATPEALLPHAAKSLLAGTYFHEQERVGELTHTRNKLAGELDDASDAVSFLEKLNVFKTAPSERKRIDLERALARAEDELHGARARAQRLLEASLASFPPLAVLARAEEARALAPTGGQILDERLAHGGRKVPVVRESGTVLRIAAVARLESSFRAAFAGVPLPGELASDVGGSPSRVEAPEPLLGAFLNELDRGRAPAVLERGLEHAAAEAGLARQRDRLAANRSWADRLAFFRDSSSDADDERARLDARIQWHRERAGVSRDELPTLAREAGQALPPFRLRDAILRALTAVDGVSAVAGEFAAPPTFALRGVDEAFAALRWVRRVLEDGWQLSGTEAELLEDVARAQPREHAVPRDDRRAFGTLSRPQLAEHLAWHLRDTGYTDTHRRVRDLEERERAAAAERSEVAARISIWERLNIFSKTPDKERSSELAHALESLGYELAAALEHLRAQLERGLHAYLPAGLHASLGAVERAVRAIRVVPHVRWVIVENPFAPAPPGFVFPLDARGEVDSWEPDSDEGDEPDDDEPDDDAAHWIQAQGDVSVEGGPGWPMPPRRPRPPRRGRPPRIPRRRPPRAPWQPTPGWPDPTPPPSYRHELRYSLELVGKEEAQAELARWARRFIEGFGVLPSYSELLESWAAGAR